MDHKEKDSDEEILSDHEVEFQTMNQENKRKKVTDELIEVAPKKKKKFENSLYKQPTVEELNQLRETENLFHSNLFRLQIEEVLNEVKLKNKYKALFEIWFEKLKAAIESIEETAEVPIVEYNLEDKSICIPVPHVPVETSNSVFKFLKPSNISIIGSYNSGCIVGPTVTVDVMVEMPAGSFRKQDYQNYVYFRKKAMYLTFVTLAIGSDIAESKKFIGDDLRPSLKLQPSGKLNKKVDVVIHISAQESSFKLNRFLPEKNSVRPGWYFDKKFSDSSLPPTPYYNSLILRDLVMSNINCEVAQIIREYPNLRDGIILLKIWLRQRDLNKGYDGFTNHIVAMFVIYLLRIKKLNTFMSSYQIVRNVWICLAQGNWCENGITLCEDKDSQKQVSHYHNYYDCVFLDTTSYHNFAATLSKNTFSWVQREAELCLKHLDNIHVDSFQALFMRNVPFYRAFDQILCFSDKAVLEKMVNDKSSIDNKINYGPDKRSQAIKIFVEVLEKGLGHRINRLCVLPSDSKEWDCTNNAPNDIGKLIIGLELNPETCFNIVDKGPEANLPEAADFRKFWGDKSELRRFQDGSIREAMVWSKGKSIADKRIICKKIIEFLLKTKFNIIRNQYLYIANQVEDLLKLRKYKITHFVYGTGEEATLKTLQAFNVLEKNLMSLNDMPLTINGVQGSSAVFRYTEVFPPLATVHRSTNKRITKDGKNCLILSENLAKSPAYVHALDVTLQLSTSGKWPEELEAIQKTKAAFHIQIAECLRKQHQLKAQANFLHVDVYQDGFVFRLKVAHQKEIALMKQINEEGVIKYRDNEESVELENKLFHLPKLSSALHGLHSQQPSFGPACCLAKRWLSAQLLDESHIPEVVIELLMASVYLMPEPYKPAQMPQVAFLRFLEFVARSHWNTDPVIVNFNGEMTNEEISAVETLFGTARDSLPPLFLSTPYDQQKSLWTRKAPSQLILNRISLLAKLSLRLFDDLVVQNTVLDVKSMFRPALSEYDCLIYLKSKMNPRRLQAVDVPDKCEIVDLHPYKTHSLQKIPVVDFDPVQCFLKDLRDGYGDHALFFHDTYGGEVIGVLLKPTALEHKDFKVSDANCRKLNVDGKLTLNVLAMIEDFSILGKGIVRTIQVSDKPFLHS
ncbi:nucleolar protein 6 [Linepithema humile]|uniref:nucleolar protein 6 n=1 Tax=Linepithema humile TaxID=83485 RepID=UPI00351EE0C7